MENAKRRKILASEYVLVQMSVSSGTLSIAFTLLICVAVCFP
jgi:hypothetical protein